MTFFSRDVEGVVEAMMNRSDAVDIYVLNVNSQGYAALFERGYLKELSGSAAISGLVAQTYPEIQGAVTADGAVVALPVRMTMGAMTCRKTALERLGMTAEEMPGSWMELLRFLRTLPDRIGETGVCAFRPYTTEEDARESLLRAMLFEYILDAMRSGGELTFDTETLRALIAEFEKIDFSRLGLARDEAEAEALRSVGIDEDAALFTINASFSLSSGSGESPSERMTLSILEGGRKILGASLTVAVVNPYSQNTDLAIQYLETVAGQLDATLLTSLCPGRNEPIEDPDYEATLAEYQETLDALLEGKSNAREQDLPLWQAEVDRVLEAREAFAKNGKFLLNAEDIARYRAFAVDMAMERYPGFDVLDAAGAYHTQIDMYEDGAIDAETFLNNLEDMARMMRLEGM